MSGHVSDLPRALRARYNCNLARKWPSACNELNPSSLKLYRPARMLMNTDRPIYSTGVRKTINRTAAQCNITYDAISGHNLPHTTYSCELLTAWLDATILYILKAYNTSLPPGWVVLPHSANTK